MIPSASAARDPRVSTSVPDVAPSSVSLAYSAVRMAVAKLAAFAVNIALPLLLVRRLGQEEFGLYKQAFLIVGTMTSALPLSFSMSALWRASDGRPQGGGTSPSTVVPMPISISSAAG